MLNLLPFLLFGVGLVLIIKGSDWFVDGAITIAKYLSISDIVIGATLVSICTTLPETIVSSGSAFHGSVDMALGNAFGSIAFNIAIVLSITIIMTKPLINDKKDFMKSGFLLVFLFILVYASFCFFGEINFYGGIILLAIMIWYLYASVQKSKNNPSKNKFVAFKISDMVKQIFILVIGATFTILGANLLIENGILIATIMNVPQSIIGLTMASVGTSLPELMTTITALRKKASDLSFGNIIGACILNVLLVLGSSAVITPLVDNKDWKSFQIPFVFILILVPVLAGTFFKRIPRLVGIISVVLYLVYMTINFVVI